MTLNRKLISLVAGFAALFALLPCESQASPRTKPKARSHYANAPSPLPAKKPSLQTNASAITPRPGPTVLPSGPQDSHPEIEPTRVNPLAAGTMFETRKELSPTTIENAPRPGSARVAVIGKVREPGTFIFQPAKVADAIEAAGGLSKDADAGKIVIRRGYLLDPANSAEIDYNYDRIRKHKEEDVELQAGDVIEIPKKKKSGFISSLNSSIKRIGSNLKPLAAPLIAMLGSKLALPLVARSRATGIGGTIPSATLPLPSSREADPPSVKLSRASQAAVRNHNELRAALETIIRQASTKQPRATSQDSKADLAATLNELASQSPEVQRLILKEIQACIASLQRTQR